MIHVIATIQFKPEQCSQLLAIYQHFVPQVLNECGCLDYIPTLDFPMNLPNQRQDSGRLLVIERWNSEAAFLAHLNQPHVLRFRKAIEGIVESVSLQISHPVL